MNKAVTLSVYMFFIFTATGQVRSTRDILGSWHVHNYRLNFFPDGTLGLIMKGGSLPGAFYTVDFQKNPAILEITVPDGRTKVKYKAALKFLSGNKIQLTWFNENNYTGLGNERTIVLEKRQTHLK